MRSLRALDRPRELARILYRDPEHICERLTLFAVQRLGQPSSDWVKSVRSARPDSPPAEIAVDLGHDSVNIARTDGAVAGTPFYVALIPGYLNYLWQETRMTLRLAALYGRDPRELHTSAQLLSLRGVHPTVPEAEAALIAVRDSPPPAKPQRRRPLRVWFTSVRRLLVFGGFLSPSTDEGEHGLVANLRMAFGLLVGAGMWAVTWIFPVTFMIMMAWGCETHTRQLFERTVEFYGDPAALPRFRHVERGAKAHIRAGLLALSIVLPMALIAVAIHFRNTVGLTWLRAVGALAAISLVIASVVIGRRR